MRVKLVSLCPTEAARQAGRPALTPELLAATGARYSRSNEGLDAILARIDPDRLDSSVDSIFRMLDYGHQSIADMAPVAIFVDGISAWLAYHLWSILPQAGGQESSTRYIRFDSGKLIAPESLGIPESERASWRGAMEQALDHYGVLYAGWQALAHSSPERVRLPAALLADGSPRGLRQAERMRRNFAFDRARYMLPVAIATNVMLVMSARSWAALCRHLEAQPLPEGRALAESLREELQLAAPRMLRHARATEALERALREEFEALAAAARHDTPPALEEGRDNPAARERAYIDVLAPPGATGALFAHDLRCHENRYAWIGATLRRTAVRFGWEAMAFAEIRDLNRHRTGNKHCPPRPLGFYAAAEQLPAAAEQDRAAAPVTQLAAALRDGGAISRAAHARLAAGDPTCVYWMLLGTQLAFEHVTTADKFIYEAELRTGAGAHFRYAKHLRDVLELWYARYPETRGAILEGAAEPE